MKKIFIILSGILLAMILCVYCIGGSIGPYVWTIAIFLFAPIAILTLFVQIFVFAIKLRKKRNVTYNIILLLLTILYTLPITVLFGKSPISYPRNAEAKDCITATMPVKDGILFDADDDRSFTLWPSECYAYDIKKEPYDITSTNLNDYGIFGADVVSPVNGTIFSVKSDEPETEINGDKYTSVLGNYMFIKIDGSNTYMILSHLKQNSIKVVKGEHVTEGMLLGQVGNSGASQKPHLHIQHQRNNPLDILISTCAEGLPIKFK